MHHAGKVKQAERGSRSCNKAPSPSDIGTGRTELTSVTSVISSVSLKRIIKFTGYTISEKPACLKNGKSEQVKSSLASTVISIPPCQAPARQV